jgi:hypothetical protein
MWSQRAFPTVIIRYDSSSGSGICQAQNLYLRFGWSLLLGWRPLLSTSGLSRQDTFWCWVFGNTVFGADAAGRAR